MKNSTIVVTDLTRFSHLDEVCLAGIANGSSECVRPMPYLKKEVCRTLGIVPGVILKMEGPVKRGADKPHVEDTDYDQLTNVGVSTSEEFEAILKESVKSSIESGFHGRISGGKVIPFDDPPPVSIITVQVNPLGIEVVKDAYNSNKLRINDMRRDLFLNTLIQGENSSPTHSLSFPNLC